MGSWAAKEERNDVPGRERIRGQAVDEEEKLGLCMVKKAGKAERT